MSTDPATSGAVRRLPALVLVLAQVALLGVALIVPFSIAWAAMGARALGIQALIPPAFDAAGVVRQGQVAPGLVILTFHDISRHPHSNYTVTPRQFADDMTVLVAAGYKGATAADLDRAVHGQPLPGRHALITFDDGTKSTWTYADPVLRRDHLHGVVFLITGRVGTRQPYYLTWSEIARMYRSGTWDFESHTHLGHDRILDGPRGQRGAFLANLEWLPRLHRFETLAEYKRRVLRDLNLSKADLVAHGLPSPTLFAYPFSATGAPSNSPAVPDVLRALLLREFTAALVDQADASVLGRQVLSERVLPRVEVMRSTTPVELYSRLIATSPIAVSEARLQQASEWCCSANEPNVRIGRNGTLRLTGARPGRAQSYYAPGRTSAWNWYRFQAEVSNLVAPQDEGMLLVRISAHSGLRVSVEPGRVFLFDVDASGGARELANHRIPLSSSYEVNVSVLGNTTLVRVDGALLLQVQTGPALAAGGVGLGTRATSAQDAPLFSDIAVIPLPAPGKA